MTIVKQVILQSEYELGTSEQTVWVDDRPDLKLGVYITLKNSEDPERLWKVTNISEMSIQSYDINRGWNNNI